MGGPVTQHRVTPRPQAPPPSALERSASGTHAGGDKLRLLAARQLAILKSTDNKCASHNLSCVNIQCITWG